MPRTRRRAALGSWFRYYVNAPRYEANAHELRLTTDDGVELHAVRLDGPAGCGATVVVVHGFANWHRHPPLHRFATRLAHHANVVVVDLRGHGLSRGVSTVGAAEWRDVAAAVNTVADDDVLTVLGTSMGGGAAVIYAGLAGKRSDLRRPDAVVAVSAPARWGRVLTLDAPWLTRLVLRFMRVRVGRRYPEARLDPVSVIGDIAPAPVFIVHDRADWYFGPEHAEAMARAAGPSAELWWRTGGHATDLLTDDLLADLLDALPLPSRQI